MAKLLLHSPAFSPVLYFCFSYVLGIDIDEDALATCQENINACDIETMDLIQADIDVLASEPGKLFKAFDTIVMNPPFGTKNAGTF